MGAALVGGISKCWCHFRARNRGNIFLASIIEFFFDLANDKSCIPMRPGCGHKQTLQVTYLQLICNWMFEWLATEISTC